MDKNELRKIIEDRIAAISGEGLQSLSNRLGSILYPGDYTPVRAGGPKGDMSNDGYCPEARVFMAAHATRGEAAASTKTKIRSDLEGCVSKHRDVREWRYLTNDTLLGDVHSYVDNEVRLLFPKVKIDLWGPDRIADTIMGLSANEISKIMDLPVELLRPVVPRVPFVYTRPSFSGGDGHYQRMIGGLTTNLSDEFILLDKILIHERVIKFENTLLRPGQELWHPGIDDLPYVDDLAQPLNKERSIEIFFHTRDMVRYRSQQKLLYVRRAADGKHKLVGAEENPDILANSPVGE